MTMSHSDANSDELPRVETPGKQARKARKRATDRVAQREHRRRQKLYVEGLETQVRVLREQSVAGKAGGTLLLENERLRAELKEVKEFCSAVEVLLKNLKKGNAEPELTGSICEEHAGATGFNAARSTRASEVSTGGANDNFTQDPHATTISDSTSDNQMGLAQGFLASDAQGQQEDTATHEQLYYQDTATTDLLQPSEHAQRNFNAMRDWWGIQSPEAQSLEHANSAKMDTPVWLSNFFAVGSLPPSGQFNDLGDSVTQNPTRDQHSFGVHFSAHESSSNMKDGTINDHHANVAQWALPELQEQDFQIQGASSKESSSLRTVNQSSTGGSPDSTRTKFEVQIHRSLPHVLMPPLPQDVYVHEIIGRARSNTLSRRMLLDAPTLADFLVDNPNNVLSSDLKKFLEPVRRSRRTAEYLGTYWVSYLLLRWQVNQSEESFARIPPWFRPTDLQMHVPHPMAIDFVAWPGIRDELIRLSQSEPEKTHEIMTTIGVYLELNLETSNFQSLTNEKVLDRAVCDLRNWKLRDEFFQIYPQWKGICEPPIHNGGFDDL
ncbi:hypothetical protein BKA64DRAFT_712408 [Cadophora sp. MPI-SDFR-AT-0126]|nr:hypothetical protein BKA64DRAFT_712408 [Leotiomycetes sp. MPI-SDFR-AT-0126]